MSTEQNRALDNGAATIDALLRMNTSLREEIKDLEARIELNERYVEEAIELHSQITNLQIDLRCARGTIEILDAVIKENEATIATYTKFFGKAAEILQLGLDKIEKDRDLIRRMADCLEEDKAKWNITAYDLVLEAKEVTQ